MTTAVMLTVSLFDRLMGAIQSDFVFCTVTPEDVQVTGYQGLC